MLSFWFSGHPGALTLIVTLLVALALDTGFGDPPWFYRRVPHPLHLMRKGVAFAGQRIESETLLAAATVVAGLAVGWLATRALTFPYGWLVEGALASTLIGFRSGTDRLRRIAQELEETAQDPAVARSTVRSIADTLAQELVGPVVWFLLLGLPGLCAYKALACLSRPSGSAPGRLTGLPLIANWPVARLAAILTALAAIFIGGASPLRALRIAWRDGRTTPIWPRAAVAGALGYRIGEGRAPKAGARARARIGEGRSDLTATDVKRSLDLIVAAGAILIASLAGIAFLIEI